MYMHVYTETKAEEIRNEAITPLPGSGMKEQVQDKSMDGCSGPA